MYTTHSPITHPSLRCEIVHTFSDQEMATNQGDSGEKECTICREALKSDDHTYRLPCSHTFHNDCLASWLKIRATCPNCRYNLNQGEVVRYSDARTGSSSGMHLWGAIFEMEHMMASYMKWYIIAHQAHAFIQLRSALPWSLIPIQLHTVLVSMHPVAHI